MVKLSRTTNAWAMTPKQRNTWLKIIVNASNAVLSGLVLGSVLGQSFRVKMFAVGLGVYVGLVTAALWVER